tara:strand:- start:299 stop:538 length:240 start_codon:yes stop_codon:yes gene_type:complete
MNYLPPKPVREYNYRPRSNLMSTYTIKSKYESAYQDLRNLLQHRNQSMGDYIIESYMELDQPAWSKKLGKRYGFQSFKK